MYSAYKETQRKGKAMFYDPLYKVFIYSCRADIVCRTGEESGDKTIYVDKGRTEYTNSIMRANSTNDEMFTKAINLSNRFTLHTAIPALHIRYAYSSKVDMHDCFKYIGNDETKDTLEKLFLNKSDSSTPELLHICHDAVFPDNVVSVSHDGTRDDYTVCYDVSLKEGIITTIIVKSVPGSVMESFINTSFDERPFEDSAVKIPSKGPERLEIINEDDNGT